MTTWRPSLFGHSPISLAELKDVYRESEAPGKFIGVVQIPVSIAFCSIFEISHFEKGVRAQR